jgi:hypothetical protein
MREKLLDRDRPVVGTGRLGVEPREIFVDRIVETQLPVFT